MRVFTNDVATVNALARADERVQATAWGDALAFGRLTADSDFDLFANVRAQVYASAHWDEDQVTESDLKLRHAALADAFEAGEELRLLFGGSLNDQLQLAQILFWLSYRCDRALRQTRLMVIDGPLSIFDDGALLEVAREGDPLDFATLDAYRTAWLAITAPDPIHVEFAFRRLGGGPYSALAAALERWLQELPSAENGLSISQAQMLDAVCLGVTSPQALFDAAQETEAAPFRVNWEYWQLINGLCSGPDPLLATRSGKPFLCPPKVMAWTDFHAQILEMTDRGRVILEGEQHLCDGAFPARWLGGARIDGESRWFWDYARNAIVSEPRVLVAPV